jgi:hypothetical protein
MIISSAGIFTTHRDWWFHLHRQHALDPVDLTGALQANGVVLPMRSSTLSAIEVPAAGRP